MRRLEGKIAVITGANSGIGLGAAKRFAAEGAYVYITGRRQEELDKAAADIGPDVTAVQGDVTKAADLDHLFETVRTQHGRIDILFANAGTGALEPRGDITEADLSEAYRYSATRQITTMKALVEMGANIVVHQDGLESLTRRVPRRKLEQAAVITGPTPLHAADVRIPDLPMTVVQADGQNVRPVKIDEFQIGVAETFDVIVTPEDRAYSFVSEAIDRSGMGRATLAPREGMVAPVPPLRPRTLLTMTDMGMDMGSMGGMQGMSGMKDESPVATRGPDPTLMQNASRNLWKLTGWKGPTDHGTVAAGAAMAGMSGMSGMDHSQMGGAVMPGMDHSQMAAGGAGMAGMDHSAMSGGSGQAGGMAGMDHGSGGGMNMNMRDPKNAPGVKMGPGVQTISPMPKDRSGEPPQGLGGLDHRVLTYRDLVSLAPNPDVRAPSRQFEIHLTGNMERYMWGFDGQKLSDPADPIPFRKGERARVTLVNDTMMPHPIHLHGHFFELVTGHGNHAPRKHTVNVPPGGKMTFDLTADAPGDWAFHCHNLYHMTAGMMRVVTVRPFAGEAA